MDIDRQRISAVRMLEALGFRCRNGEWLADDSYTMTLPFTAEADAMHAALVRRADVLEGYPGGSDEETELKAIADVLVAYEIKRWPDGKQPGGKG
jgi:hypothetical protein